MSLPGNVPHANGRRYARTFAVALATCLFGAEAFFRFAGHVPSVIDDRALWACQRSAVYDHGERTVALLGASRMQLGFSPGQFRRRFPNHHVVQLAIDNSQPMAVLRDLAADERFVGTVVCSVTPECFESQTWESQRAYVDYFHNDFSTLVAARRLLSGHIQERLVLANCRKPRYLVTRLDRSRSADYTQVDLARHRALRRQASDAAPATPPDQDRWLNDARTIDGWVKQIQARGGKVAFVVFPVADELYQIENQRYPKSHFWDRLVAVSSAKMIHFKEVPALSGFDCPDLSHLDQRDTPRFTDALLDELIRCDILSDSSLPRKPANDPTCRELVARTERSRSPATVP